VILSDRSIREAIESGRLGIVPFDPSLIQPSSIDVRLDSKFLVFRNTKRAYIDVKQPADDLMELIEVGPEEPMFLHPHEFVLGSTIERVRIPNDLVGRLEGRSSLGRLGIVIHSSLPYDEPILFLDDAGEFNWRPIGEVVKQRLPGQVVGFDRDTFEVAFHRVTNWFEELPDKIYEVRLVSGRSVHVTAGHNLFTLNGDGHVLKQSTSALRPGTRVAIAAHIPDPTPSAPQLRLLDLLPPEVQARLVCEGPIVEKALARREELRLLLCASRQSRTYWLRAGRLPLDIVKRLFGGPVPLSAGDRLANHGSPHSLPAIISIDAELAWLLGLYVAEGYRRREQVSIANFDQHILDRAEAVLAGLRQPVYRGKGMITCCSVLLSSLFDALQMGTRAPSKQLPRGALGWPRPLLEALYQGLIDGDGSARAERDCLWTTSTQLVADMLVLAARLGRRAVTQTSRAKRPGWLPLHVVSIARNRHKVLTNVPLPRPLLVEARASTGLTQPAAARLCGYSGASAINNLERRALGEAVRVTTLERLLDAYVSVATQASEPLEPIARLVMGDLLWDEVTDVVDTGRFEPVYDLSVQSRYAKIENFLAGHGGVLTSNTAGFIDASFEGHVTLEISNLANLPIALYPGMRIGQISFVEMTTPAERPYGPARGSKYSGQQLPTASRLYLDFQQ
jgi:deoxycytidine triphosphate deaminase